MTRRPPARYARAAALGALLLAGCDRGGGAPDGGDAGPATTPCGQGDASVEVGTGHPFQPLSEPRIAIERGNQGGFHIDVSIRVRGALDPDVADVDLRLLDGPRQLARHYNTETLLDIDADGPHCDYDNARLVLVDEEGGLLPESALADYTGRPLTLDVKITSPAGDALARRPLTLDPPR